MFSRTGRLAESGTGAPEAVDAQPQRARVGLDRPVEAHRERVCARSSVSMTAMSRTAVRGETRVAVGHREGALP